MRVIGLKHIPVVGVFFLGMCGLFLLKYYVRSNVMELHRAEIEIKKTREKIQVLQAELSYLSRPEQIRAIAKQSLSLNVLKQGDIVQDKGFVKQK